MNVKLQITPHVVQDVTDAPRIAVTMPRLNKNDTLTHNQQEIRKASYKETAVITRIVVLDSHAFSVFSDNLLSNMDWLNDMGGTNSDYDCPEGVTSLWQLTPEQLEQWRKQAYICVVAVVNKDDVTNQQIIVDPQGYNYARYAGEPTDTTSREIVAGLARDILAKAA